MKLQGNVMKDFFDVAAPVLNRLVDDPDRGAPNITSPTTMPEGTNQIEGELQQIDIAGEEPWELNLDNVKEEDVDAGRRVVREAGVDILAFYKSFRFRDQPPFRGSWGIFLIDAGIASVAAYYLKKRPALNAIEAQQLALKTLVFHERYHFWIDAWALAREADPFISNFYKKYEYYIEQRQMFAMTHLDFEESLANYYLMRSISKTSLNDGSHPTRLVADFLSSCPEPYSLYRLTIGKRRAYERQLAGAIVSGLNVVAVRMAGIDPFAKDLGRLSASDISFDQRKYPISKVSLCPTFIVRDPLFASRIAPFQRPKRSEFKRFITNYLAGSVERKTKHEFFKIDNGETIMFPNPHDKEIRGYELDNILKKAGLLRPEYWREKQNTKSWKKGCPRTHSKPPL